MIINYKKRAKTYNNILNKVLIGFSRNELLKTKDNLNRYIEYCAENKHINKNNKVKNNIKETLILLEAVNDMLQYKDIKQDTNTNNATSEIIKSTLEEEKATSKSNKKGDKNK